MEQYWAFYHPADPSGAIAYVAFMTEADADLVVLADPTLAYVSAPFPELAGYTVVSGVLTPPDAGTDPVVVAVFWHISDGSGAIYFVQTMKRSEADQVVLDDATLDYVEAPGPIDPNLYFISGGVLTLKPAPPAQKIFAFYHPADSSGSLVAVAMMCTSRV